MGVLTLSNFRDEIVFRLENRDDASMTDDRLNRWVNAAYNHLALPQVHRHPQLQSVETITLVESTVNYAWPTDLEYIQNVHWAEDNTFTARRRQLAPRSFRWFHERTLREGGTPTIYATRGKQILVHPIPGANEDTQLLLVTGYIQPTLLSADTDVSVFSNYWDEVMLEGSVWRAQRELGYRELAEQTRQTYAALIQEAKEPYEFEAEDTGWQPGLGGQDRRM